MNPAYLQQIKHYLSSHLRSNIYANVDSLLELLYLTYTEYNPINTAEIRNGYQQLDTIFDRLTLQENDMVFSITCKLCDEHARIAFYEGLRVGMKLTMELLDL